MMRCAICGKMTKELKSDLCFRCYVISRAIRLEPDMPAVSDFANMKPTTQRKPSGFILRPFVTDLQLHDND
jgi:hypothetical protein